MSTDLHGASATSLLTLYLRAVDAASSSPILADRWAAGALARAGGQRPGFGWARSDTATVACRGRTLDAWTAAFLAAHPDGQVLHLGCGLDSRPLRLERPPTARWLDVDRPEVIALRRRLYALPPSVDVVEASVTDDGWWARVDPARPTLAVAEGLLPYLADAEVHALLDRLVDRVPRGVLAFDGLAPWAVAASGWTPAFARMGAQLRWSYDAHELEVRHPRLVREESVGMLEAVAGAAPQAWVRLASRALSAVAPMRAAMRVVRYSWSR